MKEKKNTDKFDSILSKFSIAKNTIKMFKNNQQREVNIWNA